MATDHASAIFFWRDNIDKQAPGLSGAPSATVSTMLFGCRHWLHHHSNSGSTETRQRIETITAELEAWLTERGRQV